MITLITAEINFSQYYAPADIININNNKLAAEGDMYLDTVNNLQYIGVTNGTLKLLSPHFVRVIDKTASYTVKQEESGAVFTFNSATEVTLTLPPGLPVGFNISVYQTGIGKVNIVGGAGVSVKNRLSIFKTGGQDAGVGIVSTATDTYHLTGDLTK